MRSPAVIFILVDCPDGALDVLHAHEALVQRQVVPHRVLKHIKYSHFKQIKMRLKHGLTFQVAAFRLKNAKVCWNQL